MKDKAKKSIIRGNILKKMAIILWEKLLQYIDQNILKFSIKWLDNFKARCNIKKYKQYKKTRVINLIVIGEDLQEI